MLCRHPILSTSHVSLTLLEAFCLRGRRLPHISQTSFEVDRDRAVEVTSEVSEIGVLFGYGIEQDTLASGWDQTIGRADRTLQLAELDGAGDHLHSFEEDRPGFDEATCADTKWGNGATGPMEMSCRVYVVLTC